MRTHAFSANFAIERTEDAFVKLNQQLEQRVADQVGEIERMSRLRRFLPPQVADLIVASGTEKQLESHRREMTALFCDLRGFTGFTESADAEDVMALLRDYHAAIGEIIIKYNGTLERYAGDGVMVIFNDPVPVENPALQAVLMALELRDARRSLTDKWRRFGHDIGFGIGIAHGFATLGTIGFEGRFDYAAIGTCSNVASRLCDEAKAGQILISPRVLAAVENAVTVEPVGEFELKGIRRPLAAYNVLAAVPIVVHLLANSIAQTATLNAARIAVGQRSAARTSTGDDPRRQVWNGKRLGEDDCERLGFYSNGDPDFPDLNRLFTDCVWDADTGRWGTETVSAAQRLRSLERQ